MRPSAALCAFSSNYAGATNTHPSPFASLPNRLPTPFCRRDSLRCRRTKSAVCAAKCKRTAWKFELSSLGVHSVRQHFAARPGECVVAAIKHCASSTPMHRGASSGRPPSNFYLARFRREDGRRRRCSSRNGTVSDRNAGNWRRINCETEFLLLIF